MKVSEIIIALENGEPGIGGGGEGLFFGLFGLLTVVGVGWFVFLLLAQLGKKIFSIFKKFQTFLKSLNSKTTQTKNEPNWTSPYFKKD